MKCQALFLIFSSPELKTHDELLWSLTIRRLSISPFNHSSLCPHHIASGTTGPIFFKFHLEPSVKEGLKICWNGHGPLIKMATMPIYGKNIQRSSPQPWKLWGRILVYIISDTRCTQVCLNDDGTLTFDLFLWLGKICVLIHLHGENVKKSFSQNVLKTHGCN